jgi:hypothetical protein
MLGKVIKTALNKTFFKHQMDISRNRANIKPLTAVVYGKSLMLTKLKFRGQPSVQFEL